MHPDLLAPIVRCYHQALDHQAAMFVHEPDDERVRAIIRAHYRGVHTLLEAYVQMARTLAEDAEASDGSPGEMERFVARLRLLSGCAEVIVREVKRIGPAQAPSP